MVTRYQQGCVDVIQLDERLTHEEVEAAEAELRAVLHDRLPQVVLDMRRVRLVDSAGLELICETHTRCQRRGGAMHLASASPLLRDVLRITGLNQELILHADVVAAAGAFAL
jgi:anti-anti-sigma factor